MKVLIFGDIYGRIGRNALKKELPFLKEKYSPDFIIVNVENITSGRGPTEKHIIEIEDLGVDLMTSGDHVFDNFESIKNYLSKEDSKLIRVSNFYNDSELDGVGHRIIYKNSKKLLVVHLLGETFINHKVYNPFLKINEILKKYENEILDGIFIDFHKETTSEGYGMALQLDSKVSFVFGTHTHIQTNDELILNGGTGIISDVGMSGPIYSVIGADYNSVKNRFLSGISKGKIEQCLDKNYVVNGVFVEVGSDMLCKNIEKIRIRGVL